MTQDGAKASDDLDVSELEDLGDPGAADHLRNLDDETAAAEQRVEDAEAHLKALKKQKQERSR